MPESEKPRKSRNLRPVPEAAPAKSAEVGGSGSGTAPPVVDPTTSDPFFVKYADGSDAFRVKLKGPAFVNGARVITTVEVPEIVGRAVVRGVVVCTFLALALEGLGFLVWRALH